MIAQRRTVAAAALLASALALSACSSKASDSNSSNSSGGSVKTDIGVSNNELTLGVLTDKSGVFKALGLTVTQGNELWAKDFNDAGGVCGFKVKLEEADHGYKADVAKTEYTQQQPKVLGFVQMLGSPITAALKPNLLSDKVVATPASWSSELLDNPYVMIVGTTYDLEMIDGMSFLQEQGLIKDGDTVGHIYVDSEYGKNGLRGSQYYAGKHGMTIKDVKINSTDTDMASVVTGLKGAGVKAILLTTTPSQTASAAANDAALGLNVPLLGNNPTYAPELLKTPAAPALKALTVVASSVPFSADVPKAKQIADKYKAAYKDLPNAGVQYGYAVGEIWGQVLKKACDNKDMTRDGIAAALKQTTSANTDNLLATLDFSKAGAPATRQVYAATPDAGAEGGLKVVKPLFAAAEAKDYKAPHEG